MPIKRTDEPRCAVEYLISKLYSSALFDRVGIRGLQFAGVEWWIQDVSGEEEPKTFHTDCDLHTVFDRNGASKNIRRNPSIGSVLYLTREGGATAVFGQRRKFSSSSPTLYPRLPQEVAVVNPRQNRLFLFDGDLFHSVLHPQYPANVAGQRVGVLSCLAVYSVQHTVSMKISSYSTMNPLEVHPCPW